jgi:hypothetical protein
MPGRSEPRSGAAVALAFWPPSSEPLPMNLPELRVELHSFLNTLTAANDGEGDRPAETCAKSLAEGLSIRNGPAVSNHAQIRWRRPQAVLRSPLTASQNALVIVPASLSGRETNASHFPCAADTGKPSNSPCAAPIWRFLTTLCHAPACPGFRSQSASNRPPAPRLLWRRVCCGGSPGQRVPCWQAQS